MMENCLELNNFKLSVDGNLLLQTNHFGLKPGEIAFVMGENGSGKSTLLKALFSTSREDGYYLCEGNAQLSSIQQGFTLDVLRNGSEDLTSDEAQQCLVYISQEEYFLRFDSVIDTLFLPTKLLLNRLSKNLTLEGKFQKEAEAKKLCEEYAIKFFPDLYRYDKKYKSSADNEKKEIALKILRKKKSRSCSGGQKKMLSILAGLIKCIIINIDLLVMDEPLNHLDHKNKQQINNLLCEIFAKKPHMSALLVSHCIIFDFISDERCKQYYIDPQTKQLILCTEKIYHNCLHKM